MPVTIKTNSGGGSVTLDAGTGSLDTTLTLPNTSGTILQSGTAVTAAQGGTGLTSPGTAGNVLTSDGTNWSSSAVTVAALSTASGSAPSYSARAWVNFNGTGAVAIRGSGNVTSITDNGVGDYTVNFTTAMPDANYSVVANSGTVNASFVANRFPTTAPTTSAARIGVFDDTGVAKDDAWISVQVVR